MLGFDMLGFDMLGFDIWATVRASRTVNRRGRRGAPPFLQWTYQPAFFFGSSKRFASSTTLVVASFTASVKLA